MGVATGGLVPVVQNSVGDLLAKVCSFRKISERTMLLNSDVFLHKVARIRGELRIWRSKVLVRLNPSFLSQNFVETPLWNLKVHEDITRLSGD